MVILTALGLLVALKLLQLARGLRLDNPDQFKAKQPLLTVSTGALLGLCVALTSVGAGALVNVMLLYLYPLRMTTHKLIATDLAHAIALAAAAGLGKLLWPWLGLGMVGTLAMLWLTLGRGWHPSGSLAWVLLALWFFLALSLAMGALASSATRSLRTALSATGFITAPAFAFSGVGFPLQSMPVLARGWAEVQPYTHYIRLQMEQLQMAAPLSYSAYTLIALTLSAIILIVFCVPLLNRCAGQPDIWGGR